jgi:hypothetical protein
MLDDPVPALKRQLADAIVRVASQTNFHVAAPALGIDTARLSNLRRRRTRVVVHAFSRRFQLTSTVLMWVPR